MLLRYGVAGASVLVALLLTQVLASYVESFRTPLFYCAIMPYLICFPASSQA